jgi:hypothetical protein
MKRIITKDDLINYMKVLDTRVRKLDADVIDQIIIDSFAEFSTVSNSISNRYIVDLKPYYDAGETKFNIQIPEDVVFIYDLYLAKSTDDLLLSEHGEYHVRDESVIWADAQKRDVFHVNLEDQKYGQSYDLAYAEYIYIPHDANFTEIYMHTDAYNAYRDALSASAYDYLHDDEKALMKRSEMKRKAMSIANAYPEDYAEPKRARMFPYGV